MIELIGFTVVVTCVLAVLWIAKWWIFGAAIIALIVYTVRKWRLEDAQDAAYDAAYEAGMVARADAQYATTDAYRGFYGEFPPAVDLDGFHARPVVNLDEPEPPWIRRER